MALAVLVLALLATLIVMAALWVLRAGPFSGQTGSGQADDAISSSNAIDGEFVQLGLGSVDAKVSDKDQARAAISEFGSAFGIEDADAQLSDPDVQRGLDNTYYRFGQRYEGIPVHGRDVVLGSDAEGNVLGVTSNYLPLEGLGVEPTITLEDAVAKACEGLQDAGVLSRGLCIYAPDDIEPVLTWACEVLSPTAIELVFVDADTGEVVARESQVMRATTTLSVTNAVGEAITLNVEESDNGICQLVDSERNIWGYDANGEAADVIFVGGTDERGNSYSVNMHGNTYDFVSSSGETLSKSVCSDGQHYVLRDGEGNVVAEHARVNAILPSVNGQFIRQVEGFSSFFSSSDASQAVTLQGYLAKATDFFQTLFSRNGFDGKGGRVYGVADVMLFDNEGNESSRNAATYSINRSGWTAILYGRDLEQSYEAVVHELSHALERNVSGMFSEGESGALKEAISDLIAVAAEDYASDNRFDGAGCDWMMLDMRNLCNPLEGFDGRDASPKEYGGALWEDDNDIHENSTVISHAGYLMCMGDDLDGQALSTDLMAQLVYLTLFSLPSDCTFSQFRAAMENAASSMVMAGRLTQQQATRVSAAFDAVNVGRLQGYIDVAPDATLQVLNRNNALYGNYEATVKPVIPKWGIIGLIWDQDVVLEPQGTEPLSLVFESKGPHVVIVRNGADPSEEERVCVWVKKDSERKRLVLHTTFGETSADAEQTKHAQEPPDQRELPDQRASDIALVLDVSSSMSGEPLDQMKAAAQEFADATAGESTREGLIAYNGSADVLMNLTSDAVALADTAYELSSSGSTNIEDGLVKASQMLAPGAGTRKIIVLMSDGAPNEGKTGDELIAYASGLKESGIKIYTVGFNEGAEGYELLYAIASDGCHYEIDSADDLSDFFTDIASEIGGTHFVYARVECPVDVEVSFEGETLSSAEGSRNQRTSFGTLAFEDELDAEGNLVEENGIKVLRLKEGPAYNIEMSGTGDGEMDYSIGFADDLGDYTDFRRFEDIAVTPSMRASTTAEVAESTRLTVDEDGDGVIDRAYEAAGNQDARPVDNHLTVYLTLGCCAVATVSIGAAVAGFSRWRKQRVA